MTMIIRSKRWAKSSKSRANGYARLKSAPFGSCAIPRPAASSKTILTKTKTRGTRQAHRAALFLHSIGSTLSLYLFLLYQDCPPMDQVLSVSLDDRHGSNAFNLKG